MINVYLEYFRVQLNKIGIDARSEKGANAIEYILIAALIALVIFGIFTLLGLRVRDLACEVQKGLGGSCSPTP